MALNNNDDLYHRVILPADLSVIILLFKKISHMTKESVIFEALSFKCIYRLILGKLLMWLCENLLFINI